MSQAGSLSRKAAFAGLPSMEAAQRRFGEAVSPPHSGEPGALVLRQACAWGKGGRFGAALRARGISAPSSRIGAAPPQAEWRWKRRSDLGVKRRAPPLPAVIPEGLHALDETAVKAVPKA